MIFFSYSLEAYDGNANFGQVVLPDSFHMVLPDESSYNDISSESPVPRVTLRSYLRNRLQHTCRSLTKI